MERGDRPVVRALVAYPLTDEVFTAPALVSLALAAELHEKGYMVVVDPHDERELATWERVQRSQSFKRKWFERD